MSRKPSAAALAALGLVITAGLTACGGSSPKTPTPVQAAASQGAPESSAPSSEAPPAPATSGPASSAPAPTKAAGSYRGKFAFPVVGKSSYAHTHHDYPATDIIAACGLTAVSPIDGSVLEVTRVDTYDPKVNAGATRGGLSVSIAGADGARYYESHFSSINAGIEPGAAVKAGQAIAVVGRTGDAGACHVHFGLSPMCAKTGDWWTRRGVLYPWPYLDAWKAGTAKSPMSDLVAWQAKHGCPKKPTVDP